MGERLDSVLLHTLTAVDRLWPAPVIDSAPALKAGGGLSPGVVVGGRYRLEKVLGEGAFGRVWKAIDGNNNQACALKELLPGAEDEGGLANEFFTLSRLRHPYIVGVLDYGELDGGARYLVMELVPGHDVYQRVKHGPLPKSEVARILLGLSQGLHLLHSRLFVHCDIKAENVRVTDKGEPKLMDFGLLHQLGTPAQAVQGTVAYMAPEMIQGGVIDARTDLYSLGALAYEMYTGALPFEAASALEVMQKHLREKPKEPSWFLDLGKEIDELVLALLEKDPKNRPSSAAEVAKALAPLAGTELLPEPVAARTSYLYAASLVGRDKESSALDEIRRNLLDKKGSVVLLAGRGGEGKTRLLEEFRLRVKLDKSAWAAGQCRKEGLAPLAPIVDALTTLIARTPDDVLKPHAPVLSLILPALRARGYQPPPFTNPQQAKLATVEHITAWLKTLAEAVPFVICIEDLHWADGGTLELLNQLSRGLQGTPCVLLATFRSDEVDRTSIVYATVDEGIARLIELGGLKRDHVDELLAATLREHALDDPVVDELHATTKGNAFFLIEALRAFVEAGDLVQEAGTWRAPRPIEMPQSIDAVVSRRLAHLPADLLALSRMLAPIGRALDEKLVAATAGETRDKLSEKLEGLVARQIIVRQGAGHYFSHDSVRDGIYRSTDEEKRKDAHQKIAELLEKNVTGRPAAPSQLAHHYKRGRDQDRAVDFFLIAAREAMSKQQLLEATMMLNEGNELLEKSARKDKRTLVVTFNDMLAAASVATHPPSCVKATGALLEEWKDVKPEAVIAMMARKRRRIEAMPRFARRFFEEKPGPPPPFDPATRDPLRIFERMQQVSGMRAMALAVLGEAEAAIAAADRLVQLSPPGSPHVAVASVPKILGLLHMGKTKELRATAEATTAIFERAGDRLPPPLRIFWFLSLYFRALAEALAGTTSWEAPAERAFALADKFDLPQERGFARLPALVRACLTGEQDAFARAYGALEEITRRLGFPHVLNSRLRLWTPIYYLERGDRDLARATTARLEGMAKATRDSWIATYASVYRGFDALSDGQLEKAEQSLRAACEGARQKKLGRLTTALCAHGEALLALERKDEARKVIDEAFARATSEETGSPYDEAVARRLLARIDGEAEAHLRRALALAEEMKNPVQQGLALFELGARKNDSTLLERAREKFGAIGNKLQLRRVEEASGEL